jgi:hypothetical protein
MVMKINNYFPKQHLQNVLVKGDSVASVSGRNLHFKYLDEIHAWKRGNLFTSFIPISTTEPDPNFLY